MIQHNSTSPITIDSPHQLEDAVGSPDGFLLGFDFDGTLAPIAEDPDEPTISDSLARTLQELVMEKNVLVAIISGRELDDLVERVGIAGVTYAGNHGLELYRDGERTVPNSVERYRESVRTVCANIRSNVSAVPGCHVEEKGLTLAVHVRETPPDRTDEVRQIVFDIVGAYEGVRADEGKHLFDVRPDIPWNKGTVMKMLEDEIPVDWQTLYFGDDTTDEDVFEAIQPEGIGIHVGTREESLAKYRIPEQQQVPDFVDWLATTVTST